MIGIDTNVLVRLLVRDNEVQTRAAVAFMSQRSADDPAFVSALVVAELVWVLSKTYGYADAAIHQALEGLFESANLVIEDDEVVQRAVSEAKKSRADISDCIIAARAIHAGAEKTMTFDKPAAKRVPGMDLLS